MTNRRYLAGVDFVLVSVAASTVIALSVKVEQAGLILSLAVPVTYLVLAKLLAGADMPSAAGRAYLLCFLTSLVTLITEVPSIGTQLTSIEPDPTDPHAVQRILISSASGILPELLAPLGLGVIVYAASSVFEPTGETISSDQNNLISNITQWFESNGAPEAAVEQLRQILQTAQALDQACRSLTTQASAAEQYLGALSQSAKGSHQAIEVLTGQTNSLDRNMKELELDLVRSSAGIEQLHSAIGEMGHVIDEISEIIAKKILEL